MKLLKVGEKSKAICENCKAVVPTTLAYRDVPFRQSKGLVKDLLVAVCDQCSDVVAIPAQSTPAIRDARQKEIQAVEIKLPSPFVEVLDFAAYRIDAKADPKFRKSLLAFYIHRHAHALDELEQSGLVMIASKIPAQIKAMAALPKKRLSFKFSPHIMADIEVLGGKLSLNKTNLFASLTRKIEQDIIETDNPVHLKELKNLAVVSYA